MGQELMGGPAAETIERTACRLLAEREPRSGAMNMAIDETLLESAAERGEATFRLYRWSEPTISLGYFQKPEEAWRDPALVGLPAVRRLSGGGAILHHHEWTYSCAVPAGHPLIASPFDLYDHIHGRIVAWLRGMGIEADVRAKAAPATVRGPGAGGDAAEPFLCFGRGDPRDIVLLGFKILGSAQRRRRGAVLQHGSLLLRASEYAQQFPGLAELAGREELAQLGPGPIAEAVAPLFRMLTESSLTPGEEQRASELLNTNYEAFRNAEFS